MVKMLCHDFYIFFSSIIGLNYVYDCNQLINRDTFISTMYASVITYNINNNDLPT